MLRASLFLTCLLLSVPVSAQQAVVRTLGESALEVGQAWMMHSGEQCLAVMPLHVGTESKVPSLLLEGSPGLRGDADAPIDLGEDASVSIVHGAITQKCGASIGTINRNVSRYVAGGGLGSLRSINGDGTVARLAVTVVDDDGSTFLRVLPTVEGERIRKGQSGSLLFVNEQTVGMLQAVNARSGIGTVMWTDALLAKVETYMRSRQAGASVLTQGAGNADRRERPNLAPTSEGGHGAWLISSWNVDSVDVEHLARNLTDADATSFWQARVPVWPVVLELSGPVGVEIVGGIRFIGSGNITPGRLPLKVQVLSSVSSARPSWRAVATQDLEFDQGVAELRFLPVRARQVRIEFYSTQGATSEVSLSGIQIVRGEN